MSKDIEGRDRDYDNYSEAIPEFERSWVIEWEEKFKIISEEKNNYTEALDIFNEKTGNGHKTILYEIRKSISEGKLLKKIPLLNSSKSTERKSTERKQQILNSKEKEETTTKKANDAKFSSWKARIIILVSVFAALVVILYVINILTGGGSTISHHLILIDPTHAIGIPIHSSYNNIYANSLSPH